MSFWNTETYPVYQVGLEKIRLPSRSWKDF